MIKAACLLLNRSYLLINPSNVETKKSIKMKRSILFICSILFVNTCLLAQNNEAVIVKAGTKISDYFPISERYLYDDFTQGKATFKNKKVYPSLLNYNILSGEMEFIKKNDTLIVPDNKDLTSIVIDRDTFYYHSGYLQMIRSGELKVFSKQSVILKDILKKGAMGTVNRSAPSESYDYVSTSSLSKVVKTDLVADIDMKLQKDEVFYFSTTDKEFIQFTKSKIIKSVPGKSGVIKNYIKSNKIKFQSKEDLLQLADFVSKLLS